MLKTILRKPMLKQLQHIVNKELNVNAVNFYRKGDFFIVETEVPGYSKDELQVRMMKPDKIVISGDHRTHVYKGKGRPEDDSGEDIEWFVRERDEWDVQKESFTSFERALHIPYQAKLDDIKVVLKDGLLTIQMPRQSDPGALSMDEKSKKSHPIEIHEDLAEEKESDVRI